MDITLTYNVPLQETLGGWIAYYFFMTGLSSGVFYVTSLGYTFGVEKFKQLALPGFVLTFLFLAFAPIGLLAHSSQPLRSWHLFVFMNPTSPLSWGAYLLSFFPLAVLVYGHYFYRNELKLAKIWGFIAIAFGVALDSYKGFVLLVAKARALWTTPVMPILFIVSGLLSGVAVVVLFTVIKGRYFSKDKKIDDALLKTLGAIMLWVIGADMFIVFCDTIAHIAGTSEGREVAHHLFTGMSGLLFLGFEVMFGKLIPFVMIANPKWRKPAVYVVAAVLVLIGVMLMRYNIVVGAEHIPIV